MTIEWGVSNMDRVVSDGFVITVFWVCTAREGTEAAQVYGSQSFTYDPTEPGFIPYDDLTEEVVIGWVKTALGAEQVAAYELSAQESLNKVINPQTAVGMPWQTAPVNPFGASE